MCYGVPYLLALLNTTTSGLFMHQREHDVLHVFTSGRTNMLAIARATLVFRYSQGEIAMSSEAKAHKSAGPVELWKVWNDTTIRMWPSLLECGKEASRASFGLYTFWMRSAGIAQRQLKTSPIDPAGA